MNEKYIEIDVSFSIADTIGKAEILYSDKHLKLTFRQWNDIKTIITFEDVIGFRWDDNYMSQVKVAPDRVYEVVNSAWKNELHRELKINLKEYHHYKLYFISEASALDVIALKMSEA